MAVKCGELSVPTVEELLASLSLIYSRQWSAAVESVLLRPPGPDVRQCYAAALEIIAAAGAPPDLLPLAVIDDASVACVALNDRDGLRRGDVVRYFRTEVPPNHQGARIDVDPQLYLESVERELAVRDRGLKRVLDYIGPAYEESYLSHEKRPRDFIVRPVRIACQNVIVGLAAIAQDSSFDGLSVIAWQTCEVPHVATHEGNRALAALTLCDAFQNGGTMEIPFDRKARIMRNGKSITYRGNPERAVPASLSRFGRSVGVVLGADDPASISPAEARALFLAITPMPPELRERVHHAVGKRGIPPERICFLLLSQVWREIEMDFLLATSVRMGSILSGGATWTDRASRQAEAEACRAALPTGMLYRRLNTTDAAVDDATSVRVVEDRNKGISWTVSAEDAAVTFHGLNPKEPIPWAVGLSGADTLTVFPRSAATDDVLKSVDRSRLPGLRAILLPEDAPGPRHVNVATLRCPDRLADIDKSIEERLLKSRISRG